MAEGMTELDLMIQERRNSGTAWTRNEKFDKDGYLVIKVPLGSRRTLSSRSS